MRGDLADPRADREQEVRLAEAVDQRRVGAGAEIADETGEAVVDDVLAAERAADRQVVGIGKAGDVTAGGVAPARPADQHQRPFGKGQEPPQLAEIGGARVRPHGSIGAGNGSGAALAQHVLRDGQYRGPRAARSGDLECLVDEFGDALGEVDLRHPFGKRREHPAEVDLLKRFAVELMARHLPDQHDHRRRILKCRVNADRRVAGARPARHQQHPGPAAELAVGLGHERRPALLAAGHEADLGRVVERVEHFEIALAGDAEGHLDAMRAQRRDDELAAAHRGKIGRHRSSDLALRPPI